MKLFFSSASPYVRKVMVVAHEIGLAERLEKVPVVTLPTKPAPELMAENPLAKVPTLVLPGGEVLFDSRVICEYLDAGEGGSLFGTGAARWRNLVDQSVGDGLLDAALLLRYETVARPAELRWADWLAGQWAKIHTALDRLEARCGDLDGRVDIGTIAIACALGYFDFRFADFDWRGSRPALAAWFAAFAARDSMVATTPSA